MIYFCDCSTKKKKKTTTGFPICDNALLHGTAPVPAAPAYHGAPSPIWNGAHSYAYQSAQAYDDGQYHPGYDAPAVHDYSTNDINGPGGDKYVISPYFLFTFQFTHLLLFEPWNSIIWFLLLFSLFFV